MKFQKKLKSGDTEYYLNGLKLEGSNITVFGNKEEAWTLLTEIGDLEVENFLNRVYAGYVEIDNSDIDPYQTIICPDIKLNILGLIVGWITFRQQ